MPYIDRSNRKKIVEHFGWSNTFWHTSIATSNSSGDPSLTESFSQQIQTSQVKISGEQRFFTRCISCRVIKATHANGGA
jgi:hypothetical protein